MPYFSTNHGYFTGCILGFIKSLNKIIEIYKPNYLLVVFDNKGKNFRHILYSQYKRKRRVVNLSITKQIKDLHYIIKNMGIAVINIPNIETDDIIDFSSYKEGIKILKKYKIELS